MYRTYRYNIGREKKIDNLQSVAEEVSNDVIVVVMIMMVFVDVMMNLLGRQFGAFVPLVVIVFSLLLGHRIFRLVAADHGRGHSVAVPGATVPRRLDLRVVFFGRRRLRTNPFAVQRLPSVQDVPEMLVLQVVLLLVVLPVVMWRRDVRDRFEVVWAPRHLLGRHFHLDGRRPQRRRRLQQLISGTGSAGLTALRPCPVIAFRPR